MDMAKQNQDFQTENEQLDFFQNNGIYNPA